MSRPVTIADREAALALTHLGAPTDMRKVPVEARFAYDKYLSERRSLMKGYISALYAIDGKASAQELRRQLHELDTSIAQPILRMPTASLSVSLSRPNGAVQGKQACELAAITRLSGKTNQSYSNCGLESWRIVINHERTQQGLPAVTEEELLDWALAQGIAHQGPTRFASGGTSADGQVKALKHYGVAAHSEPQSAALVERVVAAGNAVSIGVDPHQIWPERYAPNGVHGIVVTAVQRDQAGTITGYTVNDTGVGSCGITITKAQFDAALRPGLLAVVTDKRIW